MSSKDLKADQVEANSVTNVDSKKYREELISKVKDLNERIQLLSWALQQNIIDTHVNYVVTKSLEQLNYKSRKLNIEKDFSNIKDETDAYRQKYNEDSEIMVNVEKLEVAYNKLKDLSVIAEGYRVLMKAGHEFNRYNYSVGMLAVMNIITNLDTIKSEGNIAKAALSLYDEAEDLLAYFTAHLSMEWDEIFSWTEKKGLNFLTYSLSVQQSDPLQLQKILNTLYETERLAPELLLFSGVFLFELLPKIIRHNCDISTEDHIGAIIFNIKIDLKDENKPNFQTIFNNLTAVFEFLQSTLGSHLQSDETLIQVFGKTIQKVFFEKIIEDCIRSNLPSCDSSYEAYKNIVVELDSFNKFLIEIKFVGATESPLNKYIDDTECVLYNKKCDKLLADVRSLLSQSLSYDSIEVGSDDSDQSKETKWDLKKPVYLPKCVISRNVKEIMTMITEHLEESTKLPEKYSLKLVSYIKDIAVMYQSIVPKKFKMNLECCPSDIALFFNNCYYLAHGLVGPPWSTMLLKELADRLVLVLFECIQDLRVLGLEKVSLYLQRQKNVVQQGIESKDLAAWSDEEYERFDCGINGAMSLMRDLKSSWLNVLPSKMYTMSVCSLIEVLCEAVLGRIFCNSKPVSEDFVYLIATRIGDTLEEIDTFFEEPIKLEEQIPVWTKFSRLPQLLKAQLLEISELWNKSRDHFQDYTCEEFRQIVKMRFPDDKYRLRILKEIQ